MKMFKEIKHGRNADLFYNVIGTVGSAYTVWVVV